MKISEDTEIELNSGASLSPMMMSYIYYKVKYGIRLQKAKV